MTTIALAAALFALRFVVGLAMALLFIGVIATIYKVFTK